MTKRRTKGEGSVYRYRKGWAGSAVVIDPDAPTGKRRVTVYGKTSREVVDKLKEARERSERAQSTPRPNSTPKVIDFLKNWLNTIRDSLAPATQFDYGHRLEKLVYPYLPDVKLVDFTPDRVIEMINKQKSAGFTIDKRRRSLVRLRQAMKHAVRLQLIPSNPTDVVPLPRREETKWYILSQNEISRLIKAARGRWKAFFSLAIDSGARIGELLALQWGDLDSQKRELRIERAWSRNKDGKGYVLKAPKTRAGSRTIILTQKTVGRLIALQGAREAFMWTTFRGKPWTKPSFCNHLWKPTLKRADLPTKIRFHDLRHTCASLLLAAGDSVVSVAARLGHANPAITLKIYSHFIPQTGARSASLLEDLIE